MNIRVYHPIIILVLMGVTHFFIAIPFGLYQDGKVWIDKPLHIMGGIVFAMIGLLLIQKRLENVTTFIKRLSIVNLALLGSFIWELFELGYYTWFNESALRFKFYSPTVKDALLDMLFGIIGGMIIALLVTKKANHETY